MASTRHLAAILAADVAAYSRLMGVDEEGTLERLKAHRRQLIDPKIAEHRGRIVKTTGDGLLGEFASVVDAVRCAAEVQRGMLDREPDVPDERRVQLRIGINLGDVIAEGPRIVYGYMKRNLFAAETEPLAAVLEMEAVHRARTAMTEDHLEASRAFAEKRLPVFKGR